MIDWNDIPVFLELARQGRLAPAARRLKINHATVSRRVTELERSLDQKLFDRRPDGFVLTESGRKLLPYAEAMERQAMAALDGNSGASLTGPVRVASMEGIACNYLAPRLPDLMARHADLTIELVTSPAQFNLTRREADISLSFVRPHGPRLQVRRIGSFALFLYASPGYLEANGTPASARDLDHHHFVDYVEDKVEIPAVHWLLDVVAEPDVRFRSSSMGAQASAAAAGAGLVLLPSFSGETDPRLVPVLKPDVRSERPIYLAVHEDLAWVPRVRAVVKTLEECVAGDSEFLLQGAPSRSPQFSRTFDRNSPTRR